MQVPICHGERYIFNNDQDSGFFVKSLLAAIYVTLGKLWKDLKLFQQLEDD